MKKLLLLTALCLSSVLAAQESDDNPLFYTMERLKADNPWTLSRNAAGLILNRRADFSVVEGSYLLEEGAFKNIYDAPTRHGLSLFTESFTKVDKVFFYGLFDFDYVIREKSRWSNMLDPYYSPIAMVDSVAGRQNRENYRLKGSLGFPLTSRLAVGFSADYTTASNAKKKDARNRNTLMTLDVSPSLLYEAGALEIGGSLSYLRRTEKVEYRIVGSGHSYDILSIPGMWFITNSTTLNEGGTALYDAYDNGLGGALQLGWERRNRRLMNQLSIYRGSQEVFLNQVGTERGGETERLNYDYLGAFNLEHLGPYSLYLTWEASLHTLFGFENIQQQEVVDQVAQYINYGRKQKTRTDETSFGVRANLYRDSKAWNHRWNAFAAFSFSRTHNLFYLYPIHFDQEILSSDASAGYAYNLPVTHGNLELSLSGHYRYGWGHALSERNPSGDAVPDLSLYQQNKEMLYEEYNYLTADYLQGTFNAKYTRFLNREEGTTLYLELNLSHAAPLQVKGSDTPSHRINTLINIGYTF